MWLAQMRDWLDEELALARDDAGSGGLGTGLVALERSDAEILLRGLGNAVALLDTLTVAPSSVRALAERAPPQPPGRETLQ